MTIDYFNFSSTFKFKISIHLLFNSAMIKNFKITQVGMGGKTKSWRKSNTSCPPPPGYGPAVS